MSKIYVEAPVEITLDTGFDLDEAVGVRIDVEKPDKSLVEWDAEAIPGTQSMKYTTISGQDGVEGEDKADLDMPGRYKLQAIVETDLGEIRGETAELNVYPRFK